MAVPAAHLERLTANNDENEPGMSGFLNGALNSIEHLLMGSKAGSAGAGIAHPGKRVQADESKGTLKKGRPALGDITNAQPRPQDTKPVKDKGQPLDVAAVAPADKLQQPNALQVAPPPAQLDGVPRTQTGLLAENADVVEQVVDIDAKLACWPCACSEYAQDIFKHLREAELLESRRPNPRYMDDVQNDITVSMRSILIDWLVEVAEEYKMQTDTLFLTVNYLDRFLSLRRITREILQLVGVTCMWIAAKYEEIYPPNVHEFCHITDNSYTKEDILYMEREILTALSYDLTVATSKTFLRRFLQAADADQQLHFLAGYILELALLDYDLVGFPPSMVAAAAVYVALISLKRIPWSATLEHYSNFKPCDFSVVAMMLARTHSRCFDHPELKGVRSKYASSRFLQTALRIAPVPQSVLKYYLS